MQRRSVSVFCVMKFKYIYKFAKKSKDLPSFDLTTEIDCTTPYVYKIKKYTNSNIIFVFCFCYFQILKNVP